MKSQAVKDSAVLFVASAIALVLTNYMEPLSIMYLAVYGTFMISEPLFILLLVSQRRQLLAVIPVLICVIMTVVEWRRINQHLRSNGFGTPAGLLIVMPVLLFVASFTFFSVTLKNAK